MGAQALPEQREEEEALGGLMIQCAQRTSERLRSDARNLRVVLEVMCALFLIPWPGVGATMAMCAFACLVAI